VTIEAQAVTGKVETGTAQERGAMEAKIRYRSITRERKGGHLNQAEKERGGARLADCAQPPCSRRWKKEGTQGRLDGTILVRTQDGSRILE
jgi:hypothetical protein